MNKKIISIIFLIITFSLIFSCKDEIAGSNIDDVIIPTSNISYNRYIQPIFEFKCNYSGCHDDNSAAGNLRLTSYQKVTSDFNIVLPGNPDVSMLIVRVEGRTGSPMPPPGFKPLTQNQIQGLRNWVKEGAKNN